jgi:6-phosphofructokinase
VAKTIDNDIDCTDMTFGHETASLSMPSAGRATPPDPINR